MHNTKNDLAEGVRTKMIELLNARLADCKDLQTQTKQAHWNVKGPNFIALHELFDKVAEAVEDQIDTAASRSRTAASRRPSAAAASPVCSSTGPM